MLTEIDLLTWQMGDLALRILIWVFKLGKEKFKNIMDQGSAWTPELGYTPFGSPPLE